MSLNIFNPNNSWSRSRCPEMHRSRSRKFSYDSPAYKAVRNSPGILIGPPGPMLAIFGFMGPPGPMGLGPIPIIGPGPLGPIIGLGPIILLLLGTELGPPGIMLGPLGPPIIAPAGLVRPLPGPIIEHWSGSCKRKAKWKMRAKSYY